MRMSKQDYWKWYHVQAPNQQVNRTHAARFLNAALNLNHLNVDAAKRLLYTARCFNLRAEKLPG